MREMKSLTLNEKTYDSFVDSQARKTAAELLERMENGGVLGGDGAAVLISLLRLGVYASENATALIDRLEALLSKQPGDSGSGAEGAEDYTITNMLSNITSSNSSASAPAGSSYTATLTAASGYTLSAVTVTMGGADVTSTVYSDGVVSIAAVTGNVIITAAAIAESAGGEKLTLVSPGPTRVDLNLYSDDGQTVFADKPVIDYVAHWYVDTIFDADTEVTIAVLGTTNNTNLKQYACCVPSLDSTSGYYAETIGHAQTSGYTYTYTVRAGHYLRIFNYNAGTAVSVTVTK